MSSRQLQNSVALILRIWECVDVHHPIFEHSDPTIWVSSTRGTPESNGLSSLFPPKLSEDVAFSKNLPLKWGIYHD
jgi:hypothetical protein